MFSWWEQNENVCSSNQIRTDVWILLRLILKRKLFSCFSLLLATPDCNRPFSPLCCCRVCARQPVKAAWHQRDYTDSRSYTSVMHLSVTEEFVSFTVELLRSKKKQTSNFRLSTLFTWVGINWFNFVAFLELSGHYWTVKLDSLVCCLFLYSCRKTLMSPLSRFFWKPCWVHRLHTAFPQKQRFPLIATKSAFTEEAVNRDGTFFSDVLFQQHCGSDHTLLRGLLVFWSAPAHRDSSLLLLLLICFTLTAFQQFRGNNPFTSSKRIFTVKYVKTVRFLLPVL